MASHKVRRKLLANSQFQLGPNGNVLDQILSGVVTGCMNAATTVTMSTGSFVVANANAGDMVFLTPASLPADAALVSACVTAASVVTGSFYNSGSATAAESAITMQYFIISAS